MHKSEMTFSDSFYIALCMTVLMLGVVYWFWTQNQYIQRKVNLLENIVYEMKTTLNASGGSVPAAPNGLPSNGMIESFEKMMDEDDGVDATDDEQEETNILHAELSKELEAPMKPLEFMESTSIQELSDSDLGTMDATAVDEDLQPGGVGSGIEAPVEADMNAKGSVLDGMTVKELRRLAEQKGITVNANIRKPQLIEAIRGLQSEKNSVNAPYFDIKEGKTLDLSND